MRDALLTGPFAALGGRQVKPDVVVTVPVLSLLGLSDEPASLDGYGPIAPRQPASSPRTPPASCAC